MYISTQRQLGWIPMPFRKLAPSQPASPSCDLPKWLLEYEGSPTKNRCIETTDKEFENNYVDWNIIDSTATVDSDAGKILRWEIRYKDGRTTLLDANAVPVIKGPRPRGARVSLIGNYLMKKDGFIYPIYNKAIRYDWIQTPNLIDMRYQLDTKVKALRKLRLLIFLTGIFAGNIAAGARGISNIQTISGRVLNPTDLQVLEQLAK
jgi:hypothetical protein